MYAPEHDAANAFSLDQLGLFVSFPLRRLLVVAPAQDDLCANLIDIGLLVQKKENDAVVRDQNVDSTCL